MLRTLSRALKDGWRAGRTGGERDAIEDYRANTPTFEEFEISGRMLAQASANFHEATMGWMMGVGAYRQIRLDFDDHLIRLVSTDSYGRCRNKAQGDRGETIYTVSLRLRVGDGGRSSQQHAPQQLIAMLASDFDAAAKRAGWRG